MDGSRDEGMVWRMSRGPGRTLFTDVRLFDELDSTNDWLLGEARRGAPEGLVVVTLHQRAGRGRLGRRWEAQPGSSLLMSALMRPVLAPGDLHLVTALAALAAVAACTEHGGVEVGIKWPNDLVVNDRKLGGILAEAEPSGPEGPPGSTIVVVGIGINVRWPGPAADEVGATFLEEAGRVEVDRDALLETLLDEMARRRPQLDDPVGRRALAADFAAHCTTIGREVRVVLPQETFTGRATGLTESGALRVVVAGSERTVTAGDVVHVR